MFLSLTLICFVAGFSLSALNKTTEKTIAASRDAKLRKAIQEVIPSFDNAPDEEAYEKEINGNLFKIYPAKKGSEIIGAAVEAVSKNGFNGEIRIIVGLDKQGKILNYTVLHHAETPGLGSKMENWFKTDKNNRNIIGKELSKGFLKVTKDGGDVDAITASTITSRAFLAAINDAYSAYSGTDAISSASTQQDGMSSASTQADGTSSATTQTASNTSSTEKQTDGNSSATVQTDETPSATVQTNGNSFSATQPDKKSPATTQPDATSSATAQATDTSSTEKQPDGNSSATVQTDGTSSASMQTDGNSSASVQTENDSTK